MKDIVNKFKKLEFSQIIILQAVVIFFGIIFFLSTGSGNQLLDDFGIVRQPSEEENQDRIQRTFKSQKLKDFEENPQDYYYEKDGKIVIVDDTLTLEEIKEIDEQSEEINFDYDNLTISRPAYMLRDERSREANEEDVDEIPHDLEF